jgi:Glycosyl hydrolases family 16
MFSTPNRQRRLCHSARLRKGVVHSMSIRRARTAVGFACVFLTVVGACVRVATLHADPGYGNCGKTAAQTFGWGTPNRVDDFGDPSSLSSWQLYDGPGHDENGRRTPDAISVANGALTITGDANGNSGGMAWNPGQYHGRWEVCAKSSAAPDAYHALLLLWPDAEDWPSGGEIDFMEIDDPTRQRSDLWLHYGPDDQRERASLPVDATQWHSWAVEWTPQRIAAFVDGTMWWQTTEVSHFPPRRMHLCIQLDNTGGDTSPGAQMSVDWARQYGI